MRWLRAALLLPLLGPVLARSQSALPIQGFCINGAKPAIVSGLASTNYNQNLIPLCTVTVLLHGTTTPATIFKDVNQTPLTNPFTANADASWLFFVATPSAGQAAPTYDAILSGGVAPNTYSLPRTLSNLIGASSGGGSGVVNPGLINQLAFYAAAGTVVSGTNAIPNGITATTQTPGDNSTLVATDAFVNSVAGGFVTQGGPNQIAVYLTPGVSVSGSNAVPNGITASTQAPGDNSTLIATDAFVIANGGNYLPLAGGTMTGPIAFSPNSAGTATLQNLLAGTLPGSTAVGIATAGTSGGSNYTGAPAITLSGGSCTTPPVIKVINSGGVLGYQMTSAGNCAAAPAATVGPDSTGTGATVALALAANVLQTTATGTPFQTNVTGYGNSVLANSPLLVNPLVQNLTLAQGPFYTQFAVAASPCNGQGVWLYTQGQQFLTCSTTDSISFWPNGSNTAQIRFLAQPNNDAINIFEGSSNINAIAFNPGGVFGTTGQPIQAGLEFFLANNGNLTSGGTGGGGGYTSPGTCALAGGVPVSSGTDTCSVSLGGGGSLVVSYTANVLWTSPPTSTITGATGGSGATLSSKTAINHPNIISAALWGDITATHAVHISSQRIGTFGSDWLNVSGSNFTVPPIKASSGVSCLQIDTTGNITPTGSACGSGGGGGGTVTSFAAPSANWPSWLVPTVTNPNTTPSLSVFAGPIPVSQLANLSANVILGATTAAPPQQLPIPSCSTSTNALTWTSGVGFGCNTITPSGTGTVTHTTGNLTSNQLVIGNGTGDIKVDPSAETDGAGNLTVVSASTSGTTPGKTSWAAGTGNIPALLANSAGFAAPVSGGVSYLFKLPPTITAGLLHAATPALGDNVNESLLTSSLVGIADLSATGTPNSSTFLRGDNTWAAAGGLPAATAGQGYYNNGTTAVATSDIIHTGTTAGSPLGFNVAVPLNMFDFSGSMGLLGAGPATNTTTNGSLTNIATTVTVLDTTGYPSSGLLLIGSTNFSPEFASYTGKTPTTFTGLTRSLYGTTAANPQNTGASVILVSYLLDDGPTLTPKWVCFWKGDCMYGPTNSDLISNSVANQGSLAVGSSVFAASFVVGGAAGGAGMQPSGTSGVSFFNGSATTVASISGTGQISSTGNSVSLATPTTISAASLTTTGLVMPALSSIGAPITYRGRCSIIWEQNTGVATVTFGIGASAAPTNLWVMNTIHSGASGSTLNDLYTSITSTTPTNISQAGTPGAIATGYKNEIDFTLVNPASTANTVTIYGLTSNTANALVIEPGSSCEWLP